MSSRAIGERNARRYFLTAERFDAHGGVCASGSCTPWWTTRGTGSHGGDSHCSTELLKGGPKAIAAAKDLIAHVAHRPIDQLLAEETAARIARIRVSPEGQEGHCRFPRQAAARLDQSKAK